MNSSFIIYEKGDIHVTLKLSEKCKFLLKFILQSLFIEKRKNRCCSHYRIDFLSLSVEQAICWIPKWKSQTIVIGILLSKLSQR